MKAFMKSGWLNVETVNVETHDEALSHGGDFRVNIECEGCDTRISFCMTWEEWDRLKEHIATTREFDVEGERVVKFEFGRMRPDAR